MASLQFLIERERLLYTLLPLFLFLFFLYKWLPKNHSTKGKNLPPSPPKLPIIGNLHQLGKNTHRSLQVLSQKYGQLMFIQLGTKPAVVISSAKVASQIFKTHDASISGRPQLSISRHFFYDCKDIIFAPYGEHWRKLRSMSMAQLFTNKRVQSFRTVRGEELSLMIETIKESSVVNLSNMFSSLTDDLICRTAFGRKYKVDEDGVNFDKLLKDFIDFFGRNNVEDVLPWMAWINSFNGYNAKAGEIRRVLDRFVERIVRDHAARMKERRSDIHDNESMKDFVDILIEFQRDNNSKAVPIDHEVIKGVILDIFAAGTHTNKITMEWTFTELLRHPRVMKRLQEEVRGVAVDMEAVAEEDLEKLTYLKAVIKESFRFHPAVPLPVPRQCTEDVKLNGYDIPKETLVLLNVWAIGRDPDYWEDADKLIPERFLNSPIDYKGQHFELLPFGSGRRSCPAISYAIANIEVVLANLVHQFDWSLPVGAENESLDITESPGGIPHKKTPLIAVATPRTK